eukprot:m.55890 g.55890  ORF g.55890 m.55890 type:complete len:333 (+) comp11156_c0_seq1:94-1092(+)
MKLVVCADDFGYCLGTNVGVVEAFEDGIVTQASLLVNSLSCDDAVKRAQGCDLPLGLHLNLSEGIPISSLSPFTSNKIVHYFNDSVGITENNNSYYNEHSREDTNSKPQKTINSTPSTSTATTLCFLGKAIVHSDTRLGWDEMSLRQEIRAQANLFERKTGYKCSHVDGHNHINVVENVAKGMVAELGDDFKSTRMPMFSSIEVSPPEETSFLGKIGSLTEQASCIYKAASVFHTHSFIGISYNPSTTTPQTIISDVQNLIRQDVKTCEFMSHPSDIGIDRDESVSGCGLGIVDAFACDEDRAMELSLLKDPALRQGLEELDVELVSFNDLT